MISFWGIFPTLVFLPTQQSDFGFSVIFFFRDYPSREARGLFSLFLTRVRLAVSTCLETTGLCSQGSTVFSEVFNCA